MCGRTRRNQSSAGKRFTARSKAWSVVSSSTAVVSRARPRRMSTNTRSLPGVSFLGIHVLRASSSVCSSPLLASTATISFTLERVVGAYAVPAAAASALVVGVVVGITVTVTVRIARSSPRLNLPAASATPATTSPTTSAAATAP